MTMQEGLRGLRGGPAVRQLHDKAYFLDLLGDSHNGLGSYAAAIEAYQQASQAFKAQEAHCSYALCLLKIAENHLCLDEPWHAVGYLEACVPLLRELGLARYESLARRQLDACQAALAEARLPWEGRVGPRSPEPLPSCSAGINPALTLSPRPEDKGRFLLCP
jgi:tetratricopeptide (TPR) repeat protein